MKVVFLVNTLPQPNIRSMLGHRLRRRANIDLTMGTYLTFAGLEVGNAQQNKVYAQTLLPD